MPRRPASPAILAIDLGSSSVRTALFDAQLRLLAGSNASSSYKVHHSVDHGAVLDPATLLRAARLSLRQTGALTTTPPRVVAASAFWHSLLGLDRHGQPLTPVYTWADMRGDEDAARLRTELDERVIQEKTGCMLRATFWPARLGWLRRTQPRLFKRVARWVSPAEWIFEQEFGIRACSHSMASGTGLYDLRQHDWSDELLALTGLTRSQLNPLADEIEHADAMILPAIGDGAAGNLGSGATGLGVVAINVGTSAAVRAITEMDFQLPPGLFRYAVSPPRFLLGGAVSNAGNLRAWCLRELRLPKGPQAIEKLLRQAGANDSRLTILPFWVRERAPTWPEHLDGAIHGLTQAITAADLLHASTAAFCHRLADILERLESALGPARRIIVSGGIVQSPASLQILADVLGRNLEISPSQETSLRGAAVHALEMSGGKAAPPRRGRILHPMKRAAAAARRDRERQNQLERLLSRDPAP